MPKTKQNRAKSAYATDADLAAHFGVHPTTIWGWVKRNEFPAPVKLSPQMTRWKWSEVEAWEAAREALWQRSASAEVARARLIALRDAKAVCSDYGLKTAGECAAGISDLIAKAQEEFLSRIDASERPELGAPQ